MHYTESHFEQAIIELMQGLGYTHVYGADVERDYRSPLFESVLVQSLVCLNKQLPYAAIEDALYKLKNLDDGHFIQKNIIFMDYLQHGVPVKYVQDGIEKASLVYLIDYANPMQNTFMAVNQWTVIEHSEKRPDIVLFINGLPLVVIELKSPSREETDASEAYRQLKNYMQEVPSLFSYNALCVMSDQATSKAGTITSGEDRYMEWKTVDGSYENTQAANFETLFEGIFQPERFLNILRNYICFSREGLTSYKILAGYHQYYAVNKAITSTQKATETDGKGGVFWHTQGSGKSLSMVFYAHALQEALQSPTIVIITDRNDLDDQLFAQFCHCENFLRQSPKQAASRENLRELLHNIQANGIIFTTMQKFEESQEALSTRHNIVVMADEAHRGQYGLHEKVKITKDHTGNIETASISIGTARIIRNSLPNATFIGFTGTPISAKDRSTREVFGDYIDVYDMTQAVEDGATRPVYYESRVIQLNLDKKMLALIDAEYDILAQQADAIAIEKSKKELGKMEAVLGAEQTITSLVTDIIEHYENHRAHELTGKAMIVAYSRPIAMKIYTKMLELRPEWQDKVHVVMTGSNNDPEEWRSVIGNKSYKENLARRFKDNNDSMKIAIVVDMWLTGFDVPSLATMYVYKAMAGHNLMQAIARVNRVFKDKEGGLVVDYIGIAAALKQAMNDYTVRDKKHFGEMDIKKEAYPQFLKKLEVCQDLIHGYDFTSFMHGSPLERAKTISGGVDFILGKSRMEIGKQQGKTTQDVFIKEALLLRNALSLCRSVTTEEQRLTSAFFDTVRTLLVRLLVGSASKISLPEINEQINNLLKASIKSEGIINLFADVNKDFSLFDPSFLEEISKMKEKNLAVEILKKLLAEQVKIYRKTNVVQSQRFSEILQQKINAYLNGMLSNEEIIAELLKVAQEMTNAHKEGEKLGLNAEELAFYNALTKPQAIKDFYENEQLIAMTKELADTLRKKRSVDWQNKESARAQMRKMIKRLLKRYAYPPDGVEEAMNTVIQQCELWVDNEEIHH